MTLRDYFAIIANDQDIADWQCMKPQGLMSREQARYAFADAMLEARK